MNLSAYGLHITTRVAIPPGSTPNTLRLLRLAAEDGEDEGLRYRKIVGKYCDSIIIEIENG